jgi:hypothetical protein
MRGAYFSRSNTALKACSLRARARRPAVRAPSPEMAGAFSLGKDTTETDRWFAHDARTPCWCAPRGSRRVMRAVEELLEEGSGGCTCELFASLSVLNDEVTNWLSSADISLVLLTRQNVCSE